MTEQQDKHPKRCRVCGAEISHLNQGLCKNFHYQNIPEKDDVHWITGQELREIYSDDLSLDKYDEIRKRSVPSQVDILTWEKCGRKFSCPDGEDCWYLSQDYYWDCGDGATRVHKATEKVAAEARKDEREKVLKTAIAHLQNHKEEVIQIHSEEVVELYESIVEGIESLRAPTTTPVKEQKP